MLGKANHAQTGLYNQAFFELSIGLERISKVIYLADYAINNKGYFPSNDELRKPGHKIKMLLDECDAIGKKYKTQRKYGERPTDDIHRSIEDVLHQFAIDNRYYNLDYLQGQGLDKVDPVAMWWEKVAIPICNIHYKPRNRKQDNHKASIYDNLLSEFTQVIHTSEKGMPIQSISELYKQACATRVVQRYEKMYVLQIVRWLSSIVSELSYTGGYQQRIEALFGLDEYFWIFNNSDKYFRNRKIWSIYRR